MFNFDFSKDKPNISEPIPANTKVLVRMNYTAGGADFPNTPVADRRGQLTAAKEGDALYLKAEFTVLRGPYKGRKFWENMTFAGGKVNERGESIAAAITRSNIRSILDAASGLSSKDETPAACAKRVLPNGFGDLQGRTFAVKIGVEPAKGNYGAKNKLGTILTIDHKDYPKDEAELDTMGAATNAPAKLPTLAAPAWGAPTQQVAINNGDPTKFGAGTISGNPLPLGGQHAFVGASAIHSGTNTDQPSAGLALPAAATIAAGAAAESPLPKWMQPTTA